ncbi:CD63 antigen-like [Oratosquilla oratoria]|uniref:CD63 antigen-like n=1 Tax=Oratosquilla oratoria TaxID=337810 RepID=UPI003F762340
MCDCVSKLFLFLLNFVIFALGVAVVALAGVILAKGNEFQQLFVEGEVSVPVVILIAGICVLLIGFFGCCGALKESPCLLQTYAVIVVVLLLMEIVGAIMLLVNFGAVKDGVKKEMTKAVDNYSGTGNDTDKAIDGFQKEFKCCGVSNYTDWTHTVFSQKEDVPDSCCRQVATDCGKGVLLLSPKEIEEKIHEDGCFENFIEGIASINTGLGIAAIILAIVQIVCISCACTMAKKAKRGELV